MDNREVSPEALISRLDFKYSSKFSVIAMFLFLFLPYVGLGALVVFTKDEDMHWWIRVPFALIWYGIALVIFYNLCLAWQAVRSPLSQRAHITLTDHALIFRDYMESDGKEHAFAWEELKATQQAPRPPIFNRGLTTQVLNIIDNKNNVILRISYGYWKVPLPIWAMQEYFKKEFGLAIFPTKSKK